jgi:serine/threonine-protein kinase RsbT
VAGSAQVADSILAALGEHFSAIIARSILRSALSQAGVSPSRLEQRGVDRELLDRLVRGLRMYASDASTRETAIRGLERLYASSRAPTPETVDLEIATEDDIVTARQQVRLLAAELGFDGTTRIKIATAVSELARNMYRYAGGGHIQLRSVVGARRGLHVVAEDHGPGIPNIELVLSGHYQSKTGMGLGLLGCRRLMDEFEVETGAEGTRVSAQKYLTQ